MFKYLDSFTAKSKTKENEKTYYFVLIYDDVSHTTFRVFLIPTKTSLLTKTLKVVWETSS